MLIIGTVAPIEGPEKFERIEVACESYESGHAELVRLIPGGSRLINIRVEG